MSFTLQANISSFTNRNIRDNHVVYLHDDSENEEDSFTFMATPIIEQPDFLVQEISEFSGKFIISRCLFSQKHQFCTFTLWLPFCHFCHASLTKLKLFVCFLLGTFDIKILLRNDNVPKRVVEKVLNVVANRGRVITTEDIMYKDPDVDFDSSELRYILEDLHNGQVPNHKVFSLKVNSTVIE